MGGIVGIGGNVGSGGKVGNLHLGGSVGVGGIGVGVAVGVTVGVLVGVGVIEGFGNTATAKILSLIEPVDIHAITGEVENIKAVKAIIIFLEIINSSFQNKPARLHKICLMQPK